jgi:hypothetical protein
VFLETIGVYLHFFFFEIEIKTVSSCYPSSQLSLFLAFLISDMKFPFLFNFPFNFLVKVIISCETDA